MRTRTPLVPLLTLVVPLLIPSACAAADAQGAPPTLDSDALFTQVIDEIGKALKEAFSPLPPTVSVHVDPEHLPVFAVGRDMQTGSGSLEPILKGNPEFQVVRNGRIMGLGKGNEVLVASGSMGAPVVLGGEATQHLRLPPRASLISGFRTPKGWYLLTTAGLVFDESPDTLPGSEGLTKAIKTRDGLLLLGQGHGSQSIRAAVQLESSPVIVGTLDNNGRWNTSTYSVTHGGMFDGVVRCRSGGLLGISWRIVPFAAASRPAPDETELAQVVQAMSDGNLAVLRTVLPRITLYRENLLMGLTRVLSELPERKSPAEEFLIILQESTRKIEQLSASVSGQQKESLRPLMQEHLERTRQTAASVQTAAGAGPIPPAKKVASLISRGFQYFDDRWLARVTPLVQPGFDQAILAAQTADPFTGDERNAIYQLDSAGKLRELAGFAEAGSGFEKRPSACLDREGGMFVLVPTLGLARVSNNEFEWLDQGPRMRSMDALRGVDNKGRVYIQQRPTGPGAYAGVTEYGRLNQGTTWIYRPGVRSTPATQPESLGIVDASTVDSSGKLWVISRKKPGERGPQYSPADLRPRPPHLRPSDLPSVAGGSGMPGLYCLTPDRQVRAALSSGDLLSAQLLAGRAGWVFVIAHGSVAIVKGETTLEGKNLHELASSSFSALLEAAPAATSLPPGSHDRPVGRQCLAVDRILWVLDDTRIEAYRDGKSLAIDARLKLLNASPERSLLVGPLNSPKGARILIAGEHPLTWVWAIQGTEGIQIERAERVNEAVVYPGRRDAAIVDLGHARAFLPAGNGFLEVSGDGTVKLVKDVGLPLRILGDRLLLQQLSPLTGSQLLDLTSGQTTQLQQTYRKPLTPVDVMGGQFLCMGPEGFAWLSSQEPARLIRELKVSFPGATSRYLGRVGEDLYLLSAASDLLRIPLRERKPTTSPTP